VLLDALVLEPLDGLEHRGEGLIRGGKRSVASGQRLALGGWGQLQAEVWVDRLRDARVLDGPEPVVPGLVWRQRVLLARVLRPLA
jgi:hypothetical protein